MNTPPGIQRDKLFTDFASKPLPGETGFSARTEG